MPKKRYTVNKVTVGYLQGTTNGMNNRTAIYKIVTRFKVLPYETLTTECDDGFISAGFREGTRAPTMFMCLAICATCACHLVVFTEESLLVDAINYRSARRQYFT